MQKVISVFFVVLILVLSLSPLYCAAKDLNNGEGMFEVSVPIEADSYMLVSLDDGNVIAQKNKDKTKYPASLTKIATAMVTIENVEDLEQSVSVSQHAVDVLAGTGAQVAGLEAGDKITYSKLLSLTMVYSACDACQVLAEAVGGNEAGFVKMMNEWAKKCGCKNTHFMNPDGLHDKNHYTTASDMLLMTCAALKNKTFVEASTAKFCEYAGAIFPHTNYMLNPAQGSYYYKYAQGIKTGTTTQAGNCVITKADKDGKNYLAIVLDSPMMYIGGNEMKGSFIDAKALFEWGYNDLSQKQIYNTAQTVSDIAVLYGKDRNELDLCVKSDLNALVPSGSDEKDFELKQISAPEAVEAPVKKGDTICKAQIIYKGKIIAETTLVAGEDVKLNIFAKAGAVIKGGFSKRPVLNVLCAVVLFAIAVFVIRVIRVRALKKKKAKARMNRQNKKVGTKDNNDYFNL